MIVGAGDLPPGQALLAKRRGASGGGGSDLRVVDLDSARALLQAWGRSLRTARATFFRRRISGLAGRPDYRPMLEAPNLSDTDLCRSR
jgi:hypothetical protein